MRRFVLTMAVLVMYGLHQDVWNWYEARPLVFGFLPIGLFYHVCYTLAAAVLMAVLVKFAWPAQIESPPDRPAAGETGSVRSR